MPDVGDGAPTLITSLAAVGNGITAAGLEQRLVAAGSPLPNGSAEAALDELARLGLVRVGRVTDEGRQFVTTSVGQRRLETALTGDSNEAALLAELEELRTDLLSTIAHELRTPLTVLRTSVGLLQDAAHPPDVEQRAALLATIDRNALRMQRIVGDILDLARFRAGSIQLQLRRFDARELAGAAVSSVAPLAEAAGQRLVLDAPSSAVWVFGDYRRLEQALVNLISNAQKFSPHGAAVGIAVAAEADMVRWSVTDVGPGISEADQARLFERFFVGPGDTSGSRHGVGLGLPTALAIAQAHGGSIEVKSMIGAGSTFGLAVPASGPDHGLDE